MMKKGAIYIPIDDKGFVYKCLACKRNLFMTEKGLYKCLSCKA